MKYSCVLESGPAPEGVTWRDWAHQDVPMHGLSRGPANVVIREWKPKASPFLTPLQINFDAANCASLASRHIQVGGATRLCLDLEEGSPCEQDQAEIDAVKARWPKLRYHEAWWARIHIILQTVRMAVGFKVPIVLFGPCWRARPTDDVSNPVTAKIIKTQWAGESGAEMDDEGHLTFKYPGFDMETVELYGDPARFAAQFQVCTRVRPRLAWVEYNAPNSTIQEAHRLCLANNVAELCVFAGTVAPDKCAEMGARLGEIARLLGVEKEVTA